MKKPYPLVFICDLEEEIAEARFIRRFEVCVTSCGSDPVVLERFARRRDAIAFKKKVVELLRSSRQPGLPPKS